MEEGVSNVKLFFFSFFLKNISRPITYSLITCFTSQTGVEQEDMAQVQCDRNTLAQGQRRQGHLLTGRLEQKLALLVGWMLKEQGGCTEHTEAEEGLQQRSEIDELITMTHSRGEGRKKLKQAEYQVSIIKVLILIRPPIFAPLYLASWPHSDPGQTW